MPRALKLLVGTQHHTWTTFCDAVHKVLITELEEKLEMEDEQHELLMTISHLKELQKSLTRAIAKPWVPYHLHDLFQHCTSLSSLQCCPLQCLLHLSIAQMPSAWWMLFVWHYQSSPKLQLARWHIRPRLQSGQHRMVIVLSTRCTHTRLVLGLHLSQAVSAGNVGILAIMALIVQTPTQFQ